MLLSTLAKLTPFLLAASALPLEHSVVKRDGQGSTTLAAREPASGANWVKLGCYVDTVTPRTLTGPTIVSDAGMTNEYCQQFCDARGYSIAGTEWSKECFCDNAISNSLLADDATCDMTCTGDAQTCGGSARLTVWQNQGTVTDPNQVTVGDWAGQGCYTDSVINRALPTRKWIDGMTVEKCTAACFADDFKYAGLEYGNECYCANDIITSAGVGVPATDGCNMPCEGNAAQTCGSGDRLNLYLYTPTSAPVQIPSAGDWTLKGCYTDQVNNRALAVRQYVDGGMTVEKCTAKCLSLGYSLSGLEYTNECYCSNAIGASGSPATDGCTMPCEGAASTEICGGSDRLTVYEYTGSDLEAAPTVLDAYNNWNSQGCYVDSVLERVLAPMPDAVTPMKVETCVDACLAAGFTVAGVEYASECYCGNALPPVAATDGCVMKCDGDAAHLCGGPDRLNVYQKVVVPEGPAITTPKYRIIVTKSDGTEIGYVRELLGSARLPTLTTDVSEAAIYEKEGPATNSELFDLRQINPQIADYPYFGAYTASDTWQWLANVKQTPEGATPQNIGSSFSSHNSVESRIWKKDLSTSQLNQIWVRGDGTSGPVYQTFYGNVNNPEAGGFLSSFIAGSFPAPNTPVNFYLDDVPQVETL